MNTRHTKKKHKKTVKFGKIKANFQPAGVAEMLSLPFGYCDEKYAKTGGFPLAFCAIFLYNGKKYRKGGALRGRIDCSAVRQGWYR